MVEKYLAILFLIGAASGLVLSQQTTRFHQPRGRYGPNAPGYVVASSKRDRLEFGVFGVGCACGALYCIACIRRKDTR